jgi:hypothetical protein
MHAELIQYFCVQEHEKISKDKVAKASMVRHKTPRMDILPTVHSVVGSFESI